MKSLKKQYEEIIEERIKVVEQINILEKSESVKKYLELCGQNNQLVNQQNNLYIQMKNEQYSSCTHIWVYSQIDYDSYEGRSYKYCGCMKCGLNDRVLERDFEWLTHDQQIMYNFMKKNYYNKGIYTDVVCDLDLAKAIYSRIKEVHPDIDDETARKYFEIALDNIRNIKVSEDRKVSRARRLHLSPNFSKWRRFDVTNY